MDRNEVLKQLAELQCKNVILEEKYSDAQYEVECLQSDLQQGQSVIENLQKALEASRKENFDLKQNVGGSGVESAATIEALREENRAARRRVTELEAEFRNLKVTRNSLGRDRIPEDIENQFLEWKRRLGLMPSVDIMDLFSAINDRLDRALMNDARANESEFAQQELKNQLRDAHNSANELANRVEVLLAEKEALKREANLWNAEKSDLLTTRGLLEQRISSLERQLEELREKLHFGSEEARVAKLESQQLLLERNSQTVQFNALVESLAATLSTIDSPCEVTEAGVKETVSKMMAELHRLRKAGIDLEKKVEQLLKQFDAQFANGQSLCEELDALRRELDNERRVKERIQCELDGFRLINSQKQLTPQKPGKIVSICEKLSIPVEKHHHSDIIELVEAKISDLIDQGCISPECIHGSGSVKVNPLHKKAERNHIHENLDLKNGADDCPSCSHLHTTPLDLASRAPDWTDLEERRVQFLCASCLVCLAMALKQRLRTILNSDVLNEKREKSLLEELEKSKKETEKLHEKIMMIENEKSNEYEKLEQMVSKLEALRQHQAKRIAGLQSKTQRQSTLEVQKAQELSAAKSFLIENRQKHLRLVNFRNTLGRLLGIDAWLCPNPETLIIQRIQQILMNYSTQGRGLYSQPMAVPFPTLQPSFSASQLPALTYSNDGPLDTTAPVSNTSTVNFAKQNPSGPYQSAPKAVSRRSQSASGKSVRKY